MPSSTEIIALRKSAMLTQTEFGELLGYSLRAVQCWETVGKQSRTMRQSLFETAQTKIVSLPPKRF